MKLDWNLMRTILGHVEAETLEDFLKDAEGLSKWKEGQLLSEHLNSKNKPEVRVVIKHIKLLEDGGFIQGVSIRQSSDGFLSVGLSEDPSLTLKGYSLLESLRSEGFLKKLQAFAKEKSVPLTIETIGAIISAALPQFLQ